MKDRQSLNKTLVGNQKQREMTETTLNQLMKLHFNLPTASKSYPKSVVIYLLIICFTSSAHQAVIYEKHIFPIHIESSNATINRPLRLNVQHDMQQKQIVLVQSYLSQLMLELNSGNAHDSPRLADIAYSTWTQCARCVTDIRRHVADMEYEMLPYDRKYANEYTCDAQQTTRLKILASSVHQDHAMFDDEHLHMLRRLLACLSSVCRMSEQFCEMFLNRPVSETKSCCTLLTESLQIIGYSVSVSC